jgi:hypothetical protein
MGFSIMFPSTPALAVLALATLAASRTSEITYTVATSAGFYTYEQASVVAVNFDLTTVSGICTMFDGNPCSIMDNYLITIAPAMYAMAYVSQSTTHRDRCTFTDPKTASCTASNGYLFYFPGSKYVTKTLTLTGGLDKMPITSTTTTGGSVVTITSYKPTTISTAPSKSRTKSHSGTSTAAPASPATDDSLSTGDKSGIAIGAILGVGATAALFWVLLRKARRRRERDLAAAAAGAADDDEEATVTMADSRSAGTRVSELEAVHHGWKPAGLDAASHRSELHSRQVSELSGYGPVDLAPPVELDNRVIAAELPGSPVPDAKPDAPESPVESPVEGSVDSQLGPDTRLMEGERDR